MKTILFFLLSGCMLFFSTCKDKDCTKDGSCAPEFYRFELGEAKSYLWALPGSYWIYKNTSNGDLDTQTVIEFDFDSTIVRGSESYSRHITIKYDRIYRKIFSSINQWNYSDITLSPTPNGSSFNGHNRLILERSAKNSVNCPFFNPFIIDAYFGKTRCARFDSVMMIQGNTYHEVSSFEVEIDGLWENSPPFTNSVYYWAKGVGLIKRTATHKPDNWELIEYSIVK